ncbi:MAG: zinc ribbon domain-containing protein, partial [Candidatus Parcubacteria bacterium]|nr:zinc ribbon domain-containing protein [Candidatus Parcubacteria bacterium]
MFCSKCGNELSESSKFCSKCGFQLFLDTKIDEYIAETHGNNQSLKEGKETVITTKVDEGYEYFVAGIFFGAMAATIIIYLLGYV